MNPFSQTYDPETDLDLIKAAQDGSKSAIATLVNQHQRFVFNVALRLVKNHEDAADLSQEAFVKMLTKLGQFNGKSSFRTWLYKIIFNHFLKADEKKKRSEFISFEPFGEFLDQTHVEDDLTESEHRAYNQHILESRNSCLKSMLLCLDRTQRMVFILGSIFNLRSNEAAEVLDMSPATFRKQLSRAKSDLFQFMDNKCGLINPNNPCSCSKKTKGFIREGKIDPKHKTFNSDVLEEVTEVAQGNNDQLDMLIEGKYHTLFKSTPYAKRNISNDLIASILIDAKVVDIFRLN